MRCRNSKSKFGYTNCVLFAVKHQLYILWFVLVILFKFQEQVHSRGVLSLFFSWFSQKICFFKSKSTISHQNFLMTNICFSTSDFWLAHSMGILCSIDCHSWYSIVHIVHNTILLDCTVSITQGIRCSSSTASWATKSATKMIERKWNFF